MYCSAQTREKNKCSNRARYTIQDKHYCKIHGKQLTNNLEEAKADCPICMNSVQLIKLTKTSCGHDFCMTCLRKWLRNNDNCPICRTVLVDQETAELRVLERIINHVDMNQLRINGVNQISIEFFTGYNQISMVLDGEDLEFLDTMRND